MKFGKTVDIEVLSVSNLNSWKFLSSSFKLKYLVQSLYYTIKKYFPRNNFRQIASKSKFCNAWLSYLSIKQPTNWHTPIFSLFFLDISSSYLHYTKPFDYISHSYTFTIPRYAAAEYHVLFICRYNWVGLRYCRKVPRTELIQCSASHDQNQRRFQNQPTTHI